MKKEYILIVEFTGEINRVTKGSSTNRDDRFFAALFEEVLKDDNILRDLYRLMLLSDFSGGNHIFDMEQNIISIPYRDEIEILTPLLSTLPDDAKAYFLKIFKSDDEGRDAFFEKLFNQFKNLRVTKANFMAKEKECP